MMKKILFVSLALIFSATIAFSQEKQAKDEYATRYQNLVARVGADGLGVETLLNHWNEDYPDDVNCKVGFFNFYLAKSQSFTIDTLRVSKYLGSEPMLSLKDSTGRDIYYYQIAHYDDELFGKASKILDEAIEMAPDRLDFRLLKVSALINYEGESPDMALSELKGLIDYNYTQHPKWSYPGLEMGEDAFPSLLQDYCYAFFKMGTPQTLKAFKDVSEKMLEYDPKNTLFMTNIGSYYLVAEHNGKAALKMYNKVLKLKPDDYTAIKNCVLLARNEKNTKLEKKYLQKLIQVSTDETEKASAKVRLEAL
jgi:tetratricopeptide (TPR) repeat protein